MRSRTVTLRDFTAAFGHWSNCRVGPSRNQAQVVWRRRGIRANFTTRSNLPNPGNNACTTPASVEPDTVDLKDFNWTTNRGLHTGDTLQRLITLYPHATRHATGWWLTPPKHDPVYGTYSQLVATTHRHHVSNLRLVLHAQDD